jgi:hypothetical protein
MAVLIRALDESELPNCMYLNGYFGQTLEVNQWRTEGRGLEGFNPPPEIPKF